jgi:hypothetical protein
VEFLSVDSAEWNLKNKFRRINDIPTAARAKDSAAKQAVWSNLLIRRDRDHDDDLEEIVFHARAVRVAEGEQHGEQFLSHAGKEVITTS